MPSLAVKQFSTGAADARTKKIQQPPPPNDGAAPPNNLSLPSNDEEVERENMERHEVEEVSNEVEELQDLRFKVFVGGLDKYTQEEDLRKVFGAVEEVTKVRLSWDSESKRRVAFLTFATVELARRAICEISDPVINGKRCWTAQIQDGSKTLHVLNICKEWTKDDLEDKLAEYGVKNYEVLTLNPDRENKEKNRGHAVLDFRSRKDASEALELLEKENVSFGQNRAAKADFSRKYVSGNDEIMSHGMHFSTHDVLHETVEVKRVYLDGIPRVWREEHVIKEHLKEFGRIVKVELARHIPSAIRTNYCYVTFETHEAAATCVNGVNVDGLYFRDERVNAWADLAKPRVRIPSEGTAQASSSIGLGNEVQQDSHRSHTDAPSAIDRSERSEVRVPSEGTAQASSSIGLGNEVQQVSHRSHTDAPTAIDRSERSEVRIPSEVTVQARSSIGLGNEVQQDSHRSHTDAPSAIDRSERSEVRVPSEGTAQASSSIGLGNEVQQVSHRSHTDAPSAIDRSERSEVRVPSEGTAQASSSIGLGNEVQQDSHRSHTDAPSAIDRSERSEVRVPSEVTAQASSSIGLGNDVQQDSHRSHTDAPSAIDRSERSEVRIPSEGTAQASGRPSVPSQGISRAAAHRPSRHNDYSYERNTKQPSNYYESHIWSKRPHSAVEEVCPRRTEPFVQRTRARVDHKNSYRSHSQRKEHSSRTGYGGEGVAHRPSRHNDYSYERNTKQPSNYYESHSRDYNYTSGSIRPHSSMEEVRPRSTEPFVQRSRARVDDENSYGSYSQRQEHSSRTGFGEGASSSVRNSLGLPDTRASTVASRGCEVDGGDDRRMPSRYGKDYTSRDHPRSASDDVLLYSVENPLTQYLLCLPSVIGI
uniref:Polyadenylate-binding protein n=1 Tax=Populus alba TaxID=43335 RepID=A0A4U5QHL3_POPAL|nr:polyadenylate-binding protein [Populus alba]